MSVINKEIPNIEVIPEIESGLFVDLAFCDSRFAVGLVAVNGEALPNLSNELSGIYKLRKKVYVDQTSQLDPDAEYPEGEERDDDDKRSASFGVFENQGDGKAQVVATGRIIIKSSTDDLLPVEVEWPEIFEDNPAQVGAFEVSRIISRHGNSTIAGINTSSIYSAITGYAGYYSLGPPYAIVEDWLVKGLNRRHNNGVPHTVIGPPKVVDKYLDTNYPIKIELETITDRLEAKNPVMHRNLKRAHGVHYYGKVTVPEVAKLS